MHSLTQTLTSNRRLLRLTICPAVEASFSPQIGDILLASRPFSRPNKLGSNRVPPQKELLVPCEGISHVRNHGLKVIRQLFLVESSHPQKKHIVNSHQPLQSNAAGSLLMHAQGKAVWVKLVHDYCHQTKAHPDCCDKAEGGEYILRFRQVLLTTAGCT